MSQGRPQGGAGEAGRNLRLRIVSALVLGLVTLLVTFLGGFAFRLFATALAAGVFYEWTAMHRSVGRTHMVVGRVALAAALAVMLAGLSEPISFAALGIAFLAVLLSGVVTGSGPWSAYGIAYAGGPAMALSFMRGADPVFGMLLILFLFLVVWTTDVLAYFVGRAVGGPKLAPAISPGKTWSGAVGGALGAVIAGVVAELLLFGDRGWWLTAAAALVLSLVSQAGDLFESAVKRRHRVKDSGTLIPGHGGVMDRVDGLVAAALALYLIGLVQPAFSWLAASFSR